MENLIYAVRLFLCVEHVAVLRHHYGVGFACALVIALVTKHLLCAWLLPVFPGQALLLMFATIIIGVGSIEAVLGKWHGDIVPAEYSGHSPLWKLGFTTRTVMCRIEPWLALVLTLFVLAGGGGVSYGFLPLQWPYLPLARLIDALPPMPPVYLAWLETHGHWIALGQMLIAPLALLAFNKAEYAANTIMPAYPHPPAMPSLTFYPVYAANALQPKP